MCNCYQCCKQENKPDPCPYNSLIILMGIIVYVYSMGLAITFMELMKGSQYREYYISTDREYVDSGGLLGDNVKRVVFLNVFVVLILISLFNAVGAVHEKVPKTAPWVDGGGEVDVPLCIETKGKKDKFKWGERRYCRVKTCETFKPDRTHHCKQCEQCIQGMDHHCPFINNCVGFANRKYFFVLLFWGVTCLAVTLFYTFRPFVASFSMGVFNSVHIAIIVYWLFVLLFAILITSFWLFHCSLIANGRTTLEYLERKGKRPEYDVSPFDRGLYNNVCAVLGPYVILWLLPTRVGLCTCNRKKGYCECGLVSKYDPNHPAIQKKFAGGKDVSV